MPDTEPGKRSQGLDPMGDNARWGSPRWHEDTKRSDESRENPDWRSSRRGVGDFVDACISPEVDVPLSSRDWLTTQDP